MKQTKIKDERVVQVNNKIQSEAYVVVTFLALISIFVKTYIMDMPFSQYVVELGMIIVSTTYIAIRSMLVGHDFMSTNKKKKLTIFFILGSSLAITTINGIRNYSLYSDKYTGVFDGLFLSVLVVTFISAIIFISIILVFFNWLNNKGQQRLEKKLNDEEEE